MLYDNIYATDVTYDMVDIIIISVCIIIINHVMSHVLRSLLHYKTLRFGIYFQCAYVAPADAYKNSTAADRWIRIF